MPTKVFFNATTGSKKLSLDLRKMSADDLVELIHNSAGGPVLVDEERRLYVNPAAIAYWYERGA